MSRKALIAALEALEPALRDLESALQDAGGGGRLGGGMVPFGTAGGGPGGGVPVPTPDDEDGAGAVEAGGIMGLGRKHPVVAGIAAVAALTAPIAGAGIVSQAQGGSFSAGALSEVNQMLAKVPVFGEASGISKAVRVSQAVMGDMGEKIAEIEARGGKISDDMREFLLKENMGIHGRGEDSKEKSRLMMEEIEEKDPTVNPGKASWAQIRQGVNFMVSQAGLGGIFVTSMLESVGMDDFR